MHRRTLFALSLAASLVLFAGIVRAQAPTAPTTKKPGLLGRILHKGGTPATRPGMMAHVGNIIGNKNTHVYHMPGDRGQLPAPQNRVYFRTEREAIAAGYRRAGMGHGAPGKRLPPRNAKGRFMKKM